MAAKGKKGRDKSKNEIEIHWFSLEFFTDSLTMHSNSTVDLLCHHSKNEKLMIILNQISPHVLKSTEVMDW